MKYDRIYIEFTEISFRNNDITVETHKVYNKINEISIKIDGIYK